MRLRMRVVLPEPRKPVMMVMGIGAMMIDLIEFCLCELGRIATMKPGN